MNEQELRLLVREAIARHMGATPTYSAPVHGAPVHPALLHGAPVHDISHGVFVLTESEGPCIIEPSVVCNHCGDCKSYGH